MSESLVHKPHGVIRTGWTAEVEDYALMCDWAAGGEAFVVGDASSTISCFDGKNGRLLWKKGKVHEGGLLSMAVHPGGATVASSGQNGEIVFWQISDGTLLGSKQISQNWIEHLAWSPAGTWLAAASSRTVLILDSEGVETWQSNAHQSTVSAIAWSSEEELATACYGKVTFFDFINDKVNQSLEWKGSLISMVLSPNGEIVACGSQDNSVHFWRRSNSRDAMMSGYQGKPRSLSFDNSGVLLATGGSERVTVWSFDGEGPEGTAPGELELHVKPITCLTFAPRGMRLASGSKDGSVGVWLLDQNGQGDAIGAVATFAPISMLTWRPDGRALAAASSQGSVHAWRVKN